MRWLLLFRSAVLVEGVSIVQCIGPHQNVFVKTATRMLSRVRKQYFDLDETVIFLIYIQASFVSCWYHLYGAVLDCTQDKLGQIRFRVGKPFEDRISI